MPIGTFNPQSLIDYYNDNKIKVSTPTIEETHNDLFTGKQIKTFTGTEWSSEKKYGNLYGIGSNKKSRLASEDYAREQYKKFNLRKESSQTVAWWPIKEPYILRGIQRMRKKKPQYWGTAALGDIPGLGGFAEWVDAKIHDILRLGKAIASPNGLVFIGTQLLFKIYTKAEYSFISTKIPVWERLVKVFKKGSGKKSIGDIIDILKKTRSDRSYAGLNDIASNFGHRYTWNGDRMIDPYNEADAGVFKKHDFGAMIPISFQNINGHDYIEFRGMNLRGLNQAFTATWGSKTYMGRPDQFHVYKGFKRNAISIQFDVVAFSFTGMKGMYQKLNVLAGMTAPDWNDYKRMIAPLAVLNVGDYINGENGYVSSVGITPMQNLPWEIGLTSEKGDSLTLREALGLKAALGKLGKLFKEKADKKTLAIPKNVNFATKENQKGGEVLPRGFNVSVSFTPIENELPSQLGYNRLQDRTKQYFGPDEWLLDAGLGEGGEGNG